MLDLSPTLYALLLSVFRELTIPVRLITPLAAFPSFLVHI